MERALCIVAVLCAAVAVASLWCVRTRNALLTLRLRLMEQRERETMIAVRELVAASRGSSQEVLGALDRILRRLDPTIDAVIAFVPDGDELPCAFASGERTLHYAGVRLRRDRATLVARAAARRHRIELRERAGALLSADRAAIAVPMTEDGSLLAVVHVSSCRSPAFGNIDAIARAIDHAALPYAIAVERERDRWDATYDPLTGLLTAAAFRIRLADAVARAKLLPSARLAVWFIDTDGFKAVNDTFGHAAGDAVLRGMAQLLRAHAIAGVDFVGRSGGDEFCVMLAGVPKTTAIERAQAFCDAVRGHAFERTLPITASIGVASYPLDAVEVNELLEIADAAMYHSKRCGRDRVAFAVDRASYRTFQ